MANEISISVSIRVSKNGAKYERNETFKDDMTGDSWITGVQEVGDGGSEDIITHENVTNYGWIFLKNCDTGNAYVDFAHTAASLSGDDNICRLYAGESCILKSSAETALHAISSSGAQTIEYAIIEL